MSALEDCSYVVFPDGSMKRICENDGTANNLTGLIGASGSGKTQVIKLNIAVANESMVVLDQKGAALF